jgi:hypothetical protein
MPKLTRSVSRATAAIWRERVAAWGASGQSAKAFCADQGWSWRTLLWWRARLRREAPAGAAARPTRRAAAVRAGRPRAASTKPTTLAERLRFARLVGAGLATEHVRAGAIVVEWLDARIRITVDSKAEREAIATVVELIAARSNR